MHPSHVRRAAALFVFCVSTALFAANPWDGKPFASDPKALLAAAAAVQPNAKDEGVVVLLEEANFTIDAQGRVTRTYRVVYRVVDEAAVEDWSSIDMPWSPWYEEQPAVEARVVSSDGSIHMLDPKSFGTHDAGDESDMFTDERVLRGPLPAVAAGSVVEKLITIRGKSALHEAGSVHSFTFGREVETQQTRMTIEYPSAIEIHLVNHTTPHLEATASENGGMARLRFECGRIPGIESTENNIPSDESDLSYITFSTGKSWQDVARRYSEIVDKQIGSESLAKQTAAAVGDAKEPREIAARILASVERDIRYAGVEFGEGSIVPRTPVETLGHKYGDCKDKATLLVAMLRQAGVPAHAALLDSGPGADVHPELPAVSSFDHVIVVTDGPNPIWIDPTDEFARAGELPEQDQDRLALIASPETTSLTRTPVEPSTANRSVETREFMLAEDGPASIVETSEYRGAAERSMRRYYASMEPKQQRERLEKYIDDTYRSKKLTKFSISDPHDLAKPFRITLEIADASRGNTEGGEAAVGMFTSRLVTDMPSALRGGDDDDSEPKPDEKKRKPRVHDFVFWQPYSFEIHYRVHAPAGYTLRELPKKEMRKVGTASIVKEWSVQPDGVVLGNWSCDSGPRRITAVQFEQARKDIAAIRNEEVFFLMFDQIGRKFLEAGDVGKAVAEFRRMAEMHPKEALHHIDVAQALLTGGLGAAARREAKRAVEIEPKSANAHQEVAWTLVHDLLGRPYHRGADLRTAVAEYRKAKELDPKSARIRARLAEALSWNDAGERYGKGAPLGESIDEYRQMRADKLGNEKGIDGELMALYAHSGRFADLKKLTETTKESQKKDIFHLVAIAALDGPAAGVKASESIELSKRRNALQAAGGVLTILRLYPAAAALLDAAAQGSPDAAAIRTSVDLMRRLRHHEDVVLDPKDPQSVVRQFFIDIVNGRSADVLALFDSDSQAVFAMRSELVEGVANAAMGKARAKMRGMASLDFFTDIAASAFHFQQEGSDESGLRIRALAPGAPEMTFFVTREKETYRICGANFVPAMLGLRALRLVDAGHSDGARKWLDWARDFVHGNGDDPVAAAPFAAIWTRGQAATADDIRLAAAVLMPASARASELAVPILLAAREKASDDRKTTIDIALLGAYEEWAKWSEMLSVADRLSAKYPDSATAFEKSMMALNRLGRTDEAKKRALARLAAKPDDRSALQALGRIGIESGDYASALESFGRILAQPNTTEDNYNEHAWVALFAKSDVDKAIEEARQAVSLGSESYPSLNTLATLYAETGKSSEARETLLKSLDVLDRAEPEGPDWYIVGRIAENYGIEDAAKEAYQKITKPARIHGSSYELAQKRLAALK